MKRLESGSKNKRKGDRGMKMRTIEFKPANADDLLGGIYKTDKIAFAACSAEKSGAVRQLHCFYYCREAVISTIPALFKSDTAKLSTRNTLISVHKPVGGKDDVSAFKQDITNAIKLVNHYERRNKWLLSKAYNTKHKYSKDNIIYVIKGSRWWLTSPHTFSLYMLLLRIAAGEQFNNIHKNTPNKEIIKHIMSIDEFSRDHLKTRNAAMWNILLDNRRKIFNKGSKDNFDIVEEHSSHEGILSLTDGSCYDKETYSKFIALCKKNKLYKFENER